MNYEEKYKEALERAKKLHDSYNLMHISVDEIEQIFPELAESEDERIRKELVAVLEDLILPDDQRRRFIAYLEKQRYNRMQPVYDNLDSFESALAKAWKAYNDSGARTVDGCEDDYIECAHAKGFREGYLFGLEKQKERGPLTKEEEYILHRIIEYLEDETCPSEWISLLHDIYCLPYEKQKEQKPVESISQPTVQGKGVYKICPRCKERMVRDDSMVYTSMPPQYRYECPKCGESECDTVMYDNPEMKEQKPEWSEGDKEEVKDLRYLVVAELGKYVGDDYWKSPWALDSTGVSFPLHFAKLGAEWQKEQKPAEYNEYKMLIEGAKENGKIEGRKEVIDHPDEYGLTKQKQAEWSGKDEDMIQGIIGDLESLKDWIRANDQGWRNNPAFPLINKRIDWLKSLRPSWKPNDEDEVRLINTSISFLKDFADKGYENAVECIDWLKSKLNGNTGE